MGCERLWTPACEGLGRNSLFLGLAPYQQDPKGTVVYDSFASDIFSGWRTEVGIAWLPANFEPVAERHSLSEEEGQVYYESRNIQGHRSGNHGTQLRSP